jgi:hypothetical protein
MHMSPLASIVPRYGRERARSRENARARERERERDGVRVLQGTP